MLDIVDYSLVIGIDESEREIVVGVIDYLRHYDLIKRLESGVKSAVSTNLPTIIPPQQYKNRFRAAIDSYFMTVYIYFIYYPFIVVTRSLLFI